MLVYRLIDSTLVNPRQDLTNFPHNTFRGSKSVHGQCRLYIKRSGPYKKMIRRVESEERLPFILTHLVVKNERDSLSATGFRKAGVSEGLLCPAFKFLLNANSFSL